MLTEVDTMEISILRKQGKSLRAIARYTGRSINTVRKYAFGVKALQYKTRPKQASKLTPYLDYIRHRLSLASPQWIPASVLYREICAQGYLGKIRQLQYFMASLKPQIPVKPIRRFETAPGQQMQVDWGHFQYKGTQLYAFVATLGFSRMSYVRFTEDMQIHTLVACHEEAFKYFGGIPHSILYDNMKTVVIERNAYGKGRHKLHRQLRDFAKHCGFIPRVCKPYRPQTKGKVERFIRYLRESFFIPLTTTLKEVSLSLDVDIANIEVRQWLNDVANQRLHGTTVEKPIDRFKEEQPCLLALAPVYHQSCLNVSSSKVVPSSVPDVAVQQHDLRFYDEIGGCHAA
jgi:transposase